MECDFRRSDIELGWLDYISLQKKWKKENKSDNMLKESCQILDHICSPWLTKSRLVTLVVFLSHGVQNMGYCPEDACWFKGIIIILSIVTHILKCRNTRESSTCAIIFIIWMSSYVILSRVHIIIGTWYRSWSVSIVPQMISVWVCLSL